MSWACFFQGKDGVKGDKGSTGLSGRAGEPGLRGKDVSKSWVVVTAMRNENITCVLVLLTQFQ